MLSETLNYAYTAKNHFSLLKSHNLAVERVKKRNAKSSRKNSGDFLKIILYSRMKL